MAEADEHVDVITWHHGLIARWWANFNVDGPEIDFFRPYVEAGQPGLDVGCGSGRLLVPWVAGGLDVDGVDASADMVAASRAAADAAGCAPGLYVQPTHQLDLPRQYGVAVMCGVFGLGVTRAQDLEGLCRVRAHLRGGGVVALDYEIGEIGKIDNFDAARWRPRPVNDTPPAEDHRRLGPDGCHYALRGLVTSFDPGAARLTRQVQAWQWQDGELIAHETHDIVINIYTSDEIVVALSEAGFVDIDIVGGYHGGEPSDSDQFHVFIATAP